MKRLAPALALVISFYAWYGGPLIPLGAGNDRLVEATTPDETYDVDLVRNAIELGSLDYPFYSLGHLHLNLVAVPLSIIDRVTPVSDSFILQMLRLVPLLFTAATAVLVFLFALRYFGGVAAWSALALVMLQPRVLSFGVISHPDMEQMFFVTLALYATARFAEAGAHRWFIAASAGAGLAFSAKFSGIILIPIVLATAAVRVWTAARATRNSGPEGATLSKAPLLCLVSAVVSLAFVPFERATPPPEGAPVLAEFFLDSAGTILYQRSNGLRLPEMVGVSFRDIDPATGAEVDAKLALARDLRRSAVLLTPSVPSDLWAIPVTMVIRAIAFPAGISVEVLSDESEEALARATVDSSGTILSFDSYSLLSEPRTLQAMLVSEDPSPAADELRASPELARALTVAFSRTDTTVDYATERPTRAWTNPVRVRMARAPSDTVVSASFYPMTPLPTAVPLASGRPAGQALETAKTQALARLRIATIAFSIWSLTIALLGLAGSNSFVMTLVSLTARTFICGSVFYLSFALTSPYSAANWNFLEGLLGVSAYLGNGGMIAQDLGIADWGRLLVGELGNPIVVPFVLLAAMALSIRRGSEGRARPATALLWAWTGVFLLTVSLRINSDMPHYLLPVYPALFIVIGSGFAGIVAAIRGSRVPALLTTGGLAIIALVAFQPWRAVEARDHWFRKYRDSQVVAAGRWMEQILPDTTVIMYGNGIYVPQGFARAIRVLQPTTASLTWASFEVVVMHSCDLLIGTHDDGAEEFASGEGVFNEAFDFYSKLLNGALGFEYVGEFSEILVFRKPPPPGMEAVATDGDVGPVPNREGLQRRCWSAPPHF